MASNPVIQKPFAAGKIFLYIAFLFFIILTFYFSHIPFFWDGLTYVQAAHFYYGHNFSALILPENLDICGSPLIHWMYVALSWKIFGKTLLISHLALLPFLLGIAWEYYKLAKRFLKVEFVPLAMLLLLCEPALTTQSITMGYDISKLYLFLLALNALLSGKGMLYSIAITLLCLCSIRGIMLAVFLGIIHIVFMKMIRKGFRMKELLWYLLPLAVAGGWSAFHYYETGWFFFSPSPEYEADQRTVLSVSGIVRKCIYVLWQLADFGRIFLLLFIAGGIFYLRKRIASSPATFMPALITALLVLLYLVAHGTLSTPFGHRYLLPVYACLLIAACSIAQKINWGTKKTYLLFIFLCAGLITGNFWQYGGGFSNGWDASLKILPYFEMRKEMEQFIEAEKIPPSSIGTKFPLYNNPKYTDLADKDFQFFRLENDTSLDGFPYVLFSNVSNTFTQAEKKTLAEKWVPLKEYKSGQIILNLYQNPASIGKE